MSQQHRGGTGWAIVCILGALASWTSVPLLLRFFATSSTPIDGWTANGWRYGFSALLWAPMLLWAYARKNWPERLWRRALWPSLWNAVAQVCFGLAPSYIEPGLMTFALRVQIVFVTIAAALLFAAERRIIRSPAYLVGLAMVLSGTVATLAMRPGGLGEGTGLGVALSVLSGACYAGYALSVRHFLAGINPLVAFAAVSQYTAGILLVLMLFIAPGAGAAVLDMRPLGPMLGLLAFSSVIGIGLGHTLYFVSIGRLGVAVSSAVVQLQPVTVSVASMFLFQELLTGLQWVTGVMAIAGAGLILVAQRRSTRATKVTKEPAASPEP